MPGELVTYPVQTGCCSESNLLLTGCSQQELNNKLKNTRDGSTFKKLSELLVFRSYMGNNYLIEA